MKLAERNPQPPRLTRTAPPRAQPHRQLSAIFPPPAVYFSGLSGQRLRPRGASNKALKGNTNKHIFRNRLFWFIATALTILGSLITNLPGILNALGLHRPYPGRAFDLSGKRALISAETPTALTPHPLRHQPRDRPAPIRLQRVLEAVVQAVWAPLPKLKALRRDAIAAPLIWQRDLAICKPSFHFRKF